MKDKPEKPKGSGSQTRVWTPGGASRYHPRSSSQPQPAPGGTGYRPRPGPPSGPRPARPRPGGDQQRRPRPGGRPARQKRLSPQERRDKREGFGRLYMDKQVREKTPMVFVTYDGDVAGVVAKRLVYDLDVLAGEEKVRINKLQIKFCYKQQDAEIVAKHLQHSEAVRAQSLPPIKPRKERFEIDSRQLAHARQKRLPIRVVLRGGEMFTGMIDWYSYYEIKMSLGEDEASVVVFRHAAHAFEVIGGARRDAGPYRPRPSPRSDTR